MLAEKIKKLNEVEVIPEDEESVSLNKSQGREKGLFEVDEDLMIIYKEMELLLEERRKKLKFELFFYFILVYQKISESLKRLMKIL